MVRTRRSWTAEEDALLRRAVKNATSQSRPLLWRELAKAVPGRSNKDCRRRWWNSLADCNAKGPWAEDEDERLIEAVRKYGSNWAEVARAVGSRNSDQCSSHWSQVLDPAINFSDWTDIEDSHLLHAVLTHGTNWTTIAATHKPRRTTLTLKNRYSTLRLRHENTKAKANEGCHGPPLGMHNSTGELSLNDDHSIHVRLQPDDDDDDDDDEEEDEEDNADEYHSNHSIVEQHDMDYHAMHGSVMPDGDNSLYPTISLDGDGDFFFSTDFPSTTPSPMKGLDKFGSQSGQEHYDLLGAVAATQPFHPTSTQHKLHSSNTEVTLPGYGVIPEQYTPPSTGGLRSTIRPSQVETQPSPPQSATDVPSSPRIANHSGIQSGVSGDPAKLYQVCINVVCSGAQLQSVVSLADIGTDLTLQISPKVAT